jgi:hypothetical protein
LNEAYEGEFILHILFILLWIIYPVVVFYGLSYLMNRFNFQEKVPFKIKVIDIATLFLFVGLHGLSELAFQQSILPYFLMSILLLGICVAAFQAYFLEEIKWPRFFKMFWRLTFMITCVVYLVMIIFAFIKM